ncbi:MAG: AIR synthase [Clostridiaceae bacterium]|nr:AIR synthase [Clostridiaceae bacterium]
MEIGKVPNDILNKTVLGKLNNKRSEVILRPRVGEDCCAVDFDNYTCVLSNDPVTGAINEVGRIAVHVSCNDVAACGAEPLGLLVTILAPPGTYDADIETIMTQLSETADSLNVDIMGGHTEITTSVTRFVIVTTAIGKVPKNKLVTSSGAKEGDSIILTKTAGMEGTAIIAHDKEKILSEKFGEEFVNRAKAFIENISVVKEGIIAGRFGVNAMHDVTEGGVLGALWEVAEASGKGLVTYYESIPVAHETEKICRLYSIDPLRLISSGCMVITCSDGEGLVKELESNGIKATIIGRITGEKEKILYKGNKAAIIEQPGPDELFKV